MASRPVPLRRPPGRPPSHAARAVSRLVKAGKLDRRTWLARAREETIARLAEDEGGFDGLPYRRQLMLAEAADLWVELVAVRRHRQQQILAGASTSDTDKYYLSLSNSFQRALDRLGLDPERAEKALDLAEYLRQRSTDTIADVSHGATDGTTPTAAATAAAGDTGAPVARDGDFDAEDLA